MAWLAMHAGGPYEKPVSVTDFLPPWSDLKPTPTPDDGDDPDDD